MRSSAAPNIAAGPGPGGTAELLSKWLKTTAATPAWPLRAARGVIRAKLDLRSCQRVGARPRLYGRCHVSNDGTITIGDRLRMHGGTVRCELTTHEGGRLEIGHQVFVNYGSSISAHKLVTIGNGCLIGQYTIIMDCDYHSLGGADGHGEPRPIVIEEGVWLGARTIVLKGVRIGRGSVIAAGSVVTRDIPPGVVAGGVPARVIRHLASDTKT
ncbi:MAG TPA: acyltransferase [Candidatus Dormibacteraeota bacterium]|nr:acyltransferase [Candidatus Dormibacteraeota bacterium]